MKFYDRSRELAILQDSEQQSFESAVFTVLMGQNEIDLIALNEFDHTGTIAEIKRNVHKLSINKLQEKVDALPKKDFGEFRFELKGLSLKDM